MFLFTLRSDFHTDNRFSASAAVIIRIPYLKDYKDPDFLCEYLHQHQDKVTAPELTLLLNRRNSQHLHLVQRRGQSRYRRRQPRHPPPTLPMVPRPQFSRNTEQKQAYRRERPTLECESIPHGAAVLATGSVSGRLAHCYYDRPYSESRESDQ